LEYSRKLWLRLWLAATFLFLYAPIAILILFSFNDSRRNIVWQGFTLEYYQKAFGNASLIEAFGNSLVIGLLSTLISTVIGALLALALWRFRFPRSRAPWRCRS
jgi:spermidine/putrescine transport system permease protein